MDDNGIRRFVELMSAQMKEERANSQMTLGKMIDALASLSPDAEVDALSFPHSYRGYYEDLAFERESGKMRAADLLKLCKSAMGKVFEGYKGGDFLMGENTPVWVAAYGSTGDKIMAITPNGAIEVTPDEF